MEVILIISFIFQIFALVALCNISAQTRQSEKYSKRLNEIMEIVFREHLDAENQRIQAIEDT